jgi:hypothetical protein
MAITTSNTFHIPANSDTISSARGYWNSSFKSILQNFASANAIPVTTNLNYEGSLTTAPEGMLYYNSNTGGIYVNTTGSDMNFGSGPYGTFRRLGLGTRAYDDIATAASNDAHLDPGELIVVINDTAGASNNRVYLVSDSSKTLVDVSVPYDRTVPNTAIQAETITQYEIADGAITSAKIADGTVIAADIEDETITDSKLDSSLVMLGMVL